MEEYSRILIEEYCRERNSKKSKRLNKLVRLSYDVWAEASDSDAIFLEQAIEQENDEELRQALVELDEFLFGY